MPANSNLSQQPFLSDTNESSQQQYQEPVTLPPGFQLPPNWAILPLRQFSNGLQQIQIRENVWLTLATVQYVHPSGSDSLGIPPMVPVSDPSIGTQSQPEASSASSVPNESNFASYSEQSTSGSTHSESSVRHRTQPTIEDGPDEEGII